MHRAGRLVAAVSAIALVAGGCSGRESPPENAKSETAAPDASRELANDGWAAPGSQQKPRATTPTEKAKSAPAKTGPTTTSTSVPLPPMTGTRLRDGWYRVNRSGTMSLPRSTSPHQTALIQLRRSTEGSTTHLQWSRPEGSEVDFEFFDLVPSPEGLRGGYQPRIAMGEEACTWDTPGLLQFPANPTAGKKLSDAARCHTESTQFDLRQTLEVIGKTTWMVDGKTVPAWSLRRTVHYKLSGDRGAEGDRVGNEVWLASEPMLVKAQGTNKGAAGSVTAEGEFDFFLERTAPPS